MGLKWIAQQLGVGSWKFLSNLLEQKAPNPAQPELQIFNPGWIVQRCGNMENRPPSLLIVAF